jgi:predicted Zn-dependent protease
MLGNLLNHVLPFTNQPNEAASDAAGTINALDTGAARRPNYRWSEKGGLLLLEFFARLERSAGINPLSPNAFLASHPNPQIRIPVVRDVVARNWYAQHPQVNPNAN